MNSTITKRYRVVATTTTGFVDPKIDTTVKWEGTDTDELSRAFPPSDIMFADPLFQKEIEGGFIITRFTFEQFVPGGKEIVDSEGQLTGVTADEWQKIDDPRRRLTAMTDLERAIDAENRRDFPGDYITEDDDEDDQYQVDCIKCDDRGCSKCRPGWCDDCDDNGCAKCDPNGVCKSCQRYTADVEPLDENGQCSECVYYASLCTQCVHDKADGEDRLCTNCRSNNEWEAAHKCSECYEVLVAKEGDNCPSCQAYLDSLCISCKEDVATDKDGLCTVCYESFLEMDKYYVWWRRALRACKFWR